MGSPRLGVRVQGPSVGSWTLSYGVGEFPTSWTQFFSSSGPSNFVSDNYGSLVDGFTALNTDSLPNQQIHKMRLVASNAAGTQFTTFALFKPTRAAITFPLKNRVIVPRRGWFPLGGLAHILPGRPYSVSARTAGGSAVWSSAAYSNPYTDYPATSGLFLLMHSGPTTYVSSPHQFCGYTPAVYTGDIPRFPDSSILSEGFLDYVLTVGTESDTRRVYVDASNFNSQYWPIRNLPIYINTLWGSPGQDGLDIPDLSVLPTCFHNHGRGNDFVAINPTADGSPARVLVNHTFGLTALDENGNAVWQLTTPDVYGDVFGPIVIANVDDDAANWT